MVLPLFFAYVYISIHVPSWGTTTDSKYLTSGDYLFQSTFPRGERHASALCGQLDPYFNPRSLVGNDVNVRHLYPPFYAFQSTFPRGERPSSIASMPVTILFQSTFPRGERLDPAG